MLVILSLMLEIERNTSRISRMLSQCKTLRQRIIDHVMTMKNGTDKFPPQPDTARESLMRFNEMLPELELIKGVKEDMSEHNRP